MFDYHCHLEAGDIAKDKIFKNLTEIWLYGDHYKWRAMRSNGVEEKYCTGNATDYEKFEAWANTVPYTLRNPIYHWTHLELARYFDIDDRLLNGKTAKYIYDRCNEIINSKEFSAKNIMRKMNVKAICTTDDPVDSLEYHKKIKDDGFEIKVLPAFRPDLGMAVESIEVFNNWTDKLQKVSDIDIKNFNSFIDAIKKRHNFFHEQGCRVSDHGMDAIYAENYTDNEIKNIFDKIRSKKEITKEEIMKFKSVMLIEYGKMNHEKSWVQQIHYGAIRNNNSRFFKKLGANTGFDSIGDFEIALPMAKFFDKLDKNNQLAKTIIYNINPRDNELVASMLGNFNVECIPGKMQFGSGWWFLDQKNGMTKQINALSNIGLLSRFVGMLTDSRSFLSYPRHEYFRRILCNLIGTDIENGEIPDDMDLVGNMIENISFNNAKEYFDIKLN